MYRDAPDDSPLIRAVLRRTEQFAIDEGRRPRVLVARIAHDGRDARDRDPDPDPDPDRDRDRDRDRDQKLIVSAFADLGFDVDVGPLFANPGEVAQQAVDNDVHIVYVSSPAAGQPNLEPALEHALAAQGRPDTLIVVGAAGGVEAAGAAGGVEAVALSLLDTLTDRLGHPHRTRPPDV